MDALPQTLKLDPNAHLVITGSGGEEAALRAQVRGGGLDKNVTFTGRLPHCQVREIYSMLDVMVYPRILIRTTALTTPLKPLEAMAMGKAVIVSDVPAMEELVEAGKTGETFRAGNAEDLAQQCVKLLRSASQRVQLGQSARAWVLRDRQWSSLTARYQPIYQSAMNGL